jgi:hypothetical protein
MIEIDRFILIPTIVSILEFLSQSLPVQVFAITPFLERGLIATGYLEHILRILIEKLEKLVQVSCTKSIPIQTDMNPRRCPPRTAISAVKETDISFQLILPLFQPVFPRHRLTRSFQTVI